MRIWAGSSASCFRGACARQFPISRPERRAPPVATPPGGLYGAGADGYLEAPDRRRLGACPYRRQCAECSPSKFIDGLFRTVMGKGLPRACWISPSPVKPAHKRPLFLICGKKWTFVRGFFYSYAPGLGYDACVCPIRGGPRWREPTGPVSRLSRSLCSNAARYAARGVSSWPFAAGLSGPSGLLEPSGLPFSLPVSWMLPASDLLSRPAAEASGVLALSSSLPAGSPWGTYSAFACGTYSAFV